MHRVAAVRGSGPQQLGYAFVVVNGIFAQLIIGYLFGVSIITLVSITLGLANINALKACATAAFGIDD
ncbi:hypothetical protein [Salmonella enterica]|uniref:hypothetical protein n=1 Tax=Salmonella enterica TaxID=28901 RepID=UPI00398C7EE5